MIIHNEKGVTLVEMLAVLTIATVCFVLIFGIWLSGEKSAARTMTENDLQADAHLVQARITSAFYDQTDKPFTLLINKTNGELQITYDSDPSNHMTISNPDLFYSLHNSGDPDSVHVKDASKLELNYDIRVGVSSTSSDSDSNFHLRTTLNYPWVNTQDQESGNP